MTEQWRIRIAQGGGEGPVPPLAGALAAWVLRAGGEVWVVDPRGGGAAGGEAEGEQRWPLWVHVEGGFAQDDVAACVARGHADDPREIVLFGPGVDDAAAVRRLIERFPSLRSVQGDPERGLPGVQADALADLASLPLTTFAGFGALDGGLFRLLAGRGDRARPVGAVVREIVYLVEMHGLGHVLFDDADLGAYPGWLEAFEAELAHLPWAVTWQGAT